MKRPKFIVFLHVLVMLSCCYGSVRTGLDRVDEYKNVFEGKRLGIIANHTAYDRNGRFVVDVFKRMAGVRIVALFSPEHGLWGKEQAGDGIDDRVDPAYGLPVRSLYGKTRKPTPEMLRDVDILVFDIQDIGARFYTYISTMSLAMEAAAQNGKRFVVLDRPNPINGARVEGNVLDPKLASFVGLHPIPVRHGMTVGELAKMFNGQGWLASRVRADLVVIPMEGWRRGEGVPPLNQQQGQDGLATMWYDQTGLRFIKPSPNMPDLQTAVVYPGLCLLEGTNVSEGRGTNKPFRQFGAPWINAKHLAVRLNTLRLSGVRFEPAHFTPTSSKFQGQVCNGIRIIVTDRNALEPYDAGIRIVDVIFRLYPDHFQWRAAHFDRLCGSSEIRNAIISGSSLDELRNEWQRDLTSFKKIRDEYLIYRD